VAPPVGVGAPPPTDGPLDGVDVGVVGVPVVAVGVLLEGGNLPVKIK